MSLGKDLASIRNDQGLSLEEIQSSIKIPLLTLKSIENDSIYDHPEHNITYVRSFIRSYAKALKIDDDVIVAALDAHESGKYNHELLPDVQTPTPAAPPSPQAETTEEVTDKKETKKETPPKPAPAQSVQKPAEKKPVPKKEGVESVNWADMGRKFTLQNSGSKTKLAVGSFIIFIVIVAALGFYFWEDISGWFAITDPEIIENTDQDPASTILDTENIPVVQPPVTTPEPVAEPMTLGDTLSVVVYAAYDKLEPVRVTSDFNGRTNPFWMERGRAFRFDFRDTLYVRGQYSRMLLLFNGNVIENPTNRYYNAATSSVMLTRSALENSPYLNPAPQEFPYEVGPPDSIEVRIRY